MNLDISCASLTETVCLGEVGIQMSTSDATLQGKGDHQLWIMDENFGAMSFMLAFWTFNVQLCHVIDRESLGINFITRCRLFKCSLWYKIFPLLSFKNLNSEKFGCTVDQSSIKCHRFKHPFYSHLDFQLVCINFPRIFLQRLTLNSCTKTKVYPI